MDVEVDAVEDFLLFVAFGASEAVKNGLLESPGTFSGKFETFVEVFDRYNYIIFHLDFLSKFFRFFAEVPGAPDKHNYYYGKWDKFPNRILFSYVAPGGDGFWRN